GLPMGLPMGLPIDTPAAPSGVPGPVAVSASQTHASPYAPAAPGPAPFATPPPSRRTGWIALVVLVLASAGIAALVIADHVRRSSSEPGSDKPEPDHDHEPDDKHGDPPRPPVADPWAGTNSADHWASGAAIDGQRLAVGQGVEIVFPPAFRTTVKDGATFAIDDRNVMIAVGPIELASDDPRVLAKDYARRFHLVFDSMDTIFVGGVERPKLNFHATNGGVVVRNVAVPLIGPGYRIAVAFQAPDALTQSDPSIAGLMFDLYTRRIVLP
ncbi:MAG: hypothetical protein ABIY55_00500, partial [Kofleriaceae bacterium]